MIRQPGSGIEVAVQQALEDGVLNAVTGGSRSSGRGTKVSTQAGTSTGDDFGREPTRDQDGRVIWQDLDAV